VSGPGTRPGPGSEPRGPRTSRWRDTQRWLGRTDEQRARRDHAWEEFREARAGVRRTWRDAGRADATAGGSLGSRVGSIGKFLTISVTMPIIALAIFGPVGLIVAIVLAVLLLAGRLGAAQR